MSTRSTKAITSWSALDIASSGPDRAQGARLPNRVPVADRDFRAWLFRFVIDNVVFTPHTAALTAECNRRSSIVSAQNAPDGIDGRLRPELVDNREVLNDK